MAFAIPFQSRSVISHSTWTATLTSAANNHTISVGEEVSGTMEAHGAKDNYDLTASSFGTLVVRLDRSMARVASFRRTIRRSSRD